MHDLKIKLIRDYVVKLNLLKRYLFAKCTADHKYLAVLKETFLPVLLGIFFLVLAKGFSCHEKSG